MTSIDITLGGGAANSGTVAPGSSSQHWLLRVGDGDHFIQSQPFRMWGINSKHTAWVPNFLRQIRPGDILWFIQSGNGGKAIGVAKFSHSRVREVGPLISLTPTNEELGWTKNEGEWDTEIHYTDLYDLTACDVYTQIKSPLVGRKFNESKCLINLPSIYPYIVQFAKAVLVSK